MEVEEWKIKSAGVSSITGLSKYHGKKKHPLYSRWKGINKRCHYEKDDSYKDYGGRGIYVCSEWRHDFKPFYEWAIANGYSEELEIDRKENDGPYAPWNCRFVTRSINAVNKRARGSSKFIGVNYNKHRDIYVAVISLNNEILFRRYFDEPTNGAINRDKFIVQNNLPHKLNFPENRELYSIGPTVRAFHKRNTHGLSKHPIHRRWDRIKERVRDKNLAKRGITVCDEWKDFINFYNWSIENGFSEELALVRKDSSKGYSPDNCHYIKMVYK